MILQTGMRTDIPAFFAPWLANRLRAGYVCVRNPYDPTVVTRYRLDPSVVDCIGFCSKNPGPMLPYMDMLRPYGMYWFVTITPYGRDIEPGVPDKHRVVEDFKVISRIAGADAMGWRYDPILLNARYTAEVHLRAFETIARQLEGYTKTCVISFIDLYDKVRRNFPEAHAVPIEVQIRLGQQMIEIAGRHGMTVKPCGEGDMLAPFGADCRGCMTIETYGQAIHKHIKAPAKKPLRWECACQLGSDIGVYNTCLHLCRYCYANYDAASVRRNVRLHDPESPFLIGAAQPDDIVHEAEQKSWLDGQTNLFAPLY